MCCAQWPTAWQTPIAHQGKCRERQRSELVSWAESTGLMSLWNAWLWLNIGFRLRIVEHRIQSQAKLAAMQLARLDVVQEQRCMLQLVVSPGIHQLTLSTTQLEARGTKKHARLWRSFFLQGKFYLENYDVSWGNNCFKRKKTPQNGN